MIALRIIAGIVGTGLVWLASSIGNDLSVFACAVFGATVFALFQFALAGHL